MTTSKQEIKGRALAIGSKSLALVLLAVLLAIVNYFGWKYHQRSDWTSTQLYSLSERTENLLGGLDQDVEAVVFLDPLDPLYSPVTEILARYEAASSRFSVRSIDAARNPLEAQALAERYDLASDAVVLVGQDDRQVILRDDLADFDYSGIQQGRPPEVSAFRGEGRFTGALIDLVEKRRPKVRFTTGHGEIVGGSAAGSSLTVLRRLLTDDNFEIEEWASLGQGSVPEDTDLLVIAGPGSGFAPPELDVFDRYLSDGGRMLVLLDPVLAPTGDGSLLDVGLEGWLEGWGIEVGKNVVVDPAGVLPFFGPETLFISNFDRHPITRSVDDGGLAVLVSLARSVAAGTAPEGFRATELLRTSSEGWGESDIASVERGEGDLFGPVPLGVVVEESKVPEAEEIDGEGGDPSSSGPTRLVVFGDSDFAADQLLQARDANVVLLIDALNWLVERESLLGIPPKEPERVRLSMTGTELAWTIAFALLVLPGLGIILGVVMYRRRRR
ncbi:MAG: GldG family protein [Acidobacteriota bacterium]